MSATGLCKHNNLENYCPTCKKEMGMYHYGMNGTMGADCKPGYYELKVAGIPTGQCLPTSSTALSAAQGGVVSAVGTGVASSAATQAALQSAAAQTLGEKIISFYKTKPAIAWGGTAAVVALVIYGGLSFIRGK